MEPRSPQSFNLQLYSYAYYVQTVLQRFSLPQLQNTTAFSFIFEQLFLVPNLHKENIKEKTPRKAEILFGGLQ